MPALVYKIHDNATAVDAGGGFSDEQVDLLAMMMVTLRAEWRAEMEAAIAAAVAKLHSESDQAEAVAELRGQMAVLLSLVGNGDLGSNGRSRSRKAKSVQTQVVRELTVNDRG